MSLGMALPTLVPLIMKLHSSLTMGSIAIDKETISTRLNTLAKKENATWTAYMNGEITALALDLELESIAEEKSALTAKLNALSHMTLGGAIQFATTKLTEFMAAALGFLATPMGMTLLAIAAAAGALALAFKAIHDASPEGQLEAANQRLDEAHSKAQEAADAYNELKTNLNEYKQAKEDINNMKDSDERQRAINEENNKILEMLSTIEN